MTENSEKIYVVVSGEYSDYSIEAMFSDLEQAKNYCRLHNRRAEHGHGEFDSGKGYKYEPDYRIEEHELDSKVYKVPLDRYGYEAYISQDGEAAFARQIPISNAQGCRTVWFHKADPRLMRYGTHYEEDEVCVKRKDHLRMYVLARDEAHAIKIVAEQRAQIIALDRWPKEYSSLGGATMKIEEEAENVE